MEGESVLGGFFVDLFGGVEVDAYGCFIFRHLYNIMGIITEIIILIALIAAPSVHYRAMTVPIYSTLPLGQNIKYWTVTSYYKCDQLL